MNEVFGTNKTETLKYQGLFQSMGENVGIDSKHAAIMSETMTKFTYDLASLYNKSEKDTAEALRAGVYAGQTKPLRSFGIDVTQASMKPILEGLGIEKTVSELSQAEKEILRYMAALKQGSIAMGDFANTIDSPANQIKVFKQQLVEAKVALTSLFIGTFAKILPYANAILMVIKEIAKAIATLFGIKLQDYNTGVATLSDGLSDVGDNAGNASKKVKELKREILGFDQINNINENKDTGSSGSTSGGVSGGIDQRLLDAIKGYDNGLDKVKMKATEIRDKIMEWLGFTKHINSETGETYFRLDNTNSTMYKIIAAIKDIVKFGKQAIKGVFHVLKKDFDNGVFGKLLVGILQYIAKWMEYIAKNKTAQKVIARLLETFIGFKVVKGILNPIISVFGSLTAKVISGSTAISKFVLSIGGIDVKSKTGAKAVESLSSNILKFTAGLGVAALGVTSLSFNMDDLSRHGTNLSNVLGILGGSLGTVAGLAMAGSVFGPYGAAIGACAGSVIALVTALESYKTKTEIAVESTNEAIAKSKEYNNQLKEQHDYAEKAMNQELSATSIHRDLYNELLNLVDANGKVNSSDEKRVKFILTELSNAYGVEAELIDGQITGWDNLKKSVYDVIEAKRAEIILSHKQDEYYKALENESKIRKQLKTDCDKLNEAQNNLTNAQNDYKNALELANPVTGAGMIAVNKARNAMEKAEASLKNAKNTYKETAESYRQNSLDIQNYEEILTLATEENYEEMEKVISRTSKESYKIWADNLYNQTKDIDPKNGKIGAKLVAQWTSLGMTNEKKFIEEISKLDPDLQQRIIDKMEDKGYKITSNLKKGLEKNKLKVDVDTEIKKPKDTTIKIDADTSKAETKTNNWLKRLINAFPILSITGKANGGIYAGGKWHSITAYASGGLPPSGQIFMARENGPELVGKIGSHTAVMNNGQIVDSVKAGVYEAVVSAMSQVGGQSQIDVHVHTDEGTVIDRINQKTKQTGVCPIKI